MIHSQMMHQKVKDFYPRELQYRTVLSSAFHDQLSYGYVQKKTLLVDL
jgi:hypothetical protein